MSEQQILSELRRLALIGFSKRQTHDGLQRNAGQLRKRRPGFRLDGERHQCRTRRYDRNIELLGDAVPQIARTDFRNGQAAGRDDQIATMQQTAGRIESEARIVRTGLPQMIELDRVEYLRRLHRRIR